MSKDGLLPDNVTEDMLPGSRGGHYKTCPAHEDFMLEYPECGGVGECFCSEASKAINGCDPSTECLCSEIKANEDAVRADHMRDIKEDR